MNDIVERLRLGAAEAEWELPIRASGLMTEAADEIERLRQAANPPAGHVRMPDGRDVKQPDAIGVTADGYMVLNHDCMVWHPQRENGLDVTVDRAGVVIGYAWHKTKDGWQRMVFPIDQCYILREAAEAARKEAGR